MFEAGVGLIDRIWYYFIFILFQTVRIMKSDFLMINALIEEF